MEYSIEIKKGETTSPLTVASKITQNIRGMFHQVEADGDFEKFFGATKTVASESFKVTMIIEKQEKAMQYT